MKNYPLLNWLTAGLLLAGCSAGASAAEETSSASQNPAGASATTSSTPKLAYGAADVLSLTRAQVSEEVIVSYIQTSGTIYNLRPSDILQLHTQGVSARVITVMLEQGRKSGDATSQAAPVAVAGSPVEAAPVAAVQPLNPGTPLFVPGDNAFEMAAYSQPVQYDAEAASTLYVIPFSGSGGYRPVYAFYPGCSYSSYNTCYNSYSRCASSVVRIGGTGHHFHSFHRR